MTIWTVMFGDNPLGRPPGKTCTTARVKVFNSRRTAYWFKDFCTTRGLYADVVHHPHRPTDATLH